MSEITQQRLKELLHYDPETGVFTRLDNRGGVRAGDAAGWNAGIGYIRISLDGREFAAHRLAFLYMTGAWPPHQVDHVNRIRSDNRWSNLRPATGSQNQGNIGLLPTNTSGVRGVHWSAKDKRWSARLMMNGKYTHLGNFKSKDDAADAVKKARQDHFGEFATDHHEARANKS